ncbi:hypothetical protein BGZ76_009015 [Entomortierella beljakovae]|nr:hypothetical protein BGZ76_009015 [Entomortierella beljakovae]
MTTVQSPVDTNPSHTFLENKPPLMPRQSTSDVLSFTRIIADRLAPGQNVWDYFSPAPTPILESSEILNSPSSLIGATLPTTTPLTPTSPTSPTSPTTFSFFGNKRQSMAIDTSKLPPLPPSSNCVSPTSTINQCTATSTAITATVNSGVTPRAQKRRSFAQSFRSSIYSLSQLITSSNSKASQQSTGPPHYNILVLGSDSAPLASTLYKMSSLLPSTNKISHYQEISGFFVAYFRSNGSFSCSPKTSTELSDKDRINKDSRRTDELKSRRNGLEDIDQESDSESNKQTPIRRSSAESESTLINAPRMNRHSKDASDSSTDNDDDSSTLYQELISTPAKASEEPTVPIKASANASLSIHAFSLDTTWPVPRMLAQTFWFPHAHGIIYIVDVTRKNDPRGMDHLLNSRQFLSTLINDPHFKRRDIPIVVFANKAGLDDDCYRVDEIADILGCEDWDNDANISFQAAELEQSSNSKSSKSKSSMTTDQGSPSQRPWCVKSTRSDGNGDGLRESVEWLKSRMGEIWKS